MKNPTIIGHLSTGEAVYYSDYLGLTIERDHRYLTSPTDAEELEIRERMPAAKEALNGKANGV